MLIRQAAALRAGPRPGPSDPAKPVDIPADFEEDPVDDDEDADDDDTADNDPADDDAADEADRFRY